MHLFIMIILLLGFLELMKPRKAACQWYISGVRLEAPSDCKDLLMVQGCLVLSNRSAGKIAQAEGGGGKVQS